MHQHLMCGPLQPSPRKGPQGRWLQHSVALGPSRSFPAAGRLALVAAAFIRNLFLKPPVHARVSLHLFCFCPSPISYLSRASCGDPAWENRL